MRPQAHVRRLAPRMPQIQISFNKATGEVATQIDQTQFKDPNELRAWAQNMQHHIFSRVLIKAPEKGEIHAAAVRVREVVTQLVEHQIACGELLYSEGQWRYYPNAL